MRTTEKASVEERGYSTDADTLKKHGDSGLPLPASTEDSDEATQGGRTLMRDIRACR